MPYDESRFRMLSPGDPLADIAVPASREDAVRRLQATPGHWQAEPALIALHDVWSIYGVVSWGHTGLLAAPHIRIEHLLFLPLTRCTVIQSKLNCKKIPSCDRPRLLQPRRPVTSASKERVQTSRCQLNMQGAPQLLEK